MQLRVASCLYTPIHFWHPLLPRVLQHISANKVTQSSVCVPTRQSMPADNTGRLTFRWAGALLDMR